jgi:thioredoxin reductase (NADPH)
VIVGGDSACEEAHYLLNFVKKVTMLVRSEKFRVLKSWKLVYAKPKIMILMNHDNRGSWRRAGGDRCRALNKTTNEEFDIPATGFFVNWT